ncbi:unnamed protein product [Pieris brassicae]|uniref:Reverse transcriptase/retrotransposon-derived protein RNase H-like domain-containing protein n=1 Tax=Pieris brassicae TaxID=7116 RepID=A0A9P0TJK1_PIEBR|nr:unnamed protein product [Pieris brassicae]
MSEEDEDTLYYFAVIARPLTDLIKKDASWIWRSDQNNSFDQLKKCSKPVLAFYDTALSTEIHDACKLGIAGILLQKQMDGTLHPVIYFSRVTSKEEKLINVGFVPTASGWPSVTEMTSPVTSCQAKPPC